MLRGIEGAGPYAAGLLAAWVLLAIPAVAPADPLASYAWSHRPLVVIAPAPDDPKLAQLRTILAEERAALIDREMPVIEIVGDTAAVSSLGAAAAAALPATTARELRRRFDAGPDDFLVALVGKDTGTKRVLQNPGQVRTMFTLIDRMPMRQREMRKRAATE